MLSGCRARSRCSQPAAATSVIRCPMATTYGSRCNDFWNSLSNGNDLRKSFNDLRKSFISKNGRNIGAVLLSVASVGHGRTQTSASSQDADGPGDVHVTETSGKLNQNPSFCIYLEDRVC